MTLWLIGGIDPTGGAGVVRDHWTATVVSPQLPSSIVVTTFTRQGAGPARATPCPATRLAEQLAALPSPSAVKIGLVPDPVTHVVVEAVSGLSVPIVVDPVMRASDGGDLGATADGLGPLIDLATLTTPNVPEAVRLCRLQADGEVLFGGLRRRFPNAAVLLKGGHARDGRDVIDRLAVGSSVFRFPRRRQPGPGVRGTGCALATAVACRLARGQGVAAAVEAGIAWLDRARRRARPGPDGRMHLPP